MKNIFVVGLDDFYLRYLRQVRNAEQYSFHGLLRMDEIVRSRHFDLPALMSRARSELDEFEGKVDAIVGYWDFPTTLSLPLLREHVGLPGPTLESVLRCEHKYWSRLVQSEVAAEHIPDFSSVDPSLEPADAMPELDFPFWMKPVKAHSSKLGFLVRDQEQFDEALRRTRDGISEFAEPMNYIMRQADIPDHIARVHGGMCIAEGIISQGRQCTLEGYVLGGRIRVYGVVDSMRGRNRSSFSRYEYPSDLPLEVQDRMQRIARRVVLQTGLDNSPFNIEFYWNRSEDTIWLLEINARLSKSHFPLFAKVEGSSHAEVMIEVALGHEPDYPTGKGDFKHAAKFMERVYGMPDDAQVSHAPTGEEIDQIESEIPGVHIELLAEEGMRVGDILVHDSYSHEVAVIFVGADSHDALMKKHKSCLQRLDIRIDGRPCLQK